MVKRGDYVVVSSPMQTLNALVLDVSREQHGRLGANGEPPVHVVVIQEPRKPLPLGEVLQPTILHDVVHESATVQDNRGPWQWSLPIQEEIEAEEIANDEADLGKPTSEDLDAVAAEQQAAEETKGDQ